MDEGQTPIKKILKKAVKFEIETYKKFPDMTLNHVAFTGSPQKHPLDKNKVILIVDPFSTQTFYYEFNTADVQGIEELPSLVTMEGESVNMVRLWVRKGSIGVKSVPFVVEDTTRKQCRS